MQTPPRLRSDAALFLDFDGTLVGIAETPEAIEVPQGLVALLTDLHDWLGGALAVVSGRQIDVLDRFLAPLRLPAAGEHGVQRRDATGNMREQTPPDLQAVLDVANHLAGNYPDLLVERKHAAVALHYRRAPQLEHLCRNALLGVIAKEPRLELMHGKAVFEVKPAGINKGIATDESGFAIVQPRGGVAIKVGSGPSLAQHRLESPLAVFEWLAAARGAQPDPTPSSSARNSKDEPA